MVSVVKFFSELNAPGRLFAPKKQTSKTYFPIKRPGRLFGKLRYVVFTQSRLRNKDEDYATVNKRVLRKFYLFTMVVYEKISLELP